MTLNIKLFDGWMLLSDNNNIILARKEGNRIVHNGFFSNIESAIQSFIDMRIKGFDSTSIESLLKEIKSLETRLNKTLQALNLRVVGSNSTELIKNQGREIKNGSY